MMRFVDGGAQYSHPILPLPHFRRKWGRLGGGPRNIANRTRDYCHLMSSRSEQARELMMASPAGFIQGSKGLMDNEDMHSGRWTAKSPDFAPKSGDFGLRFDLIYFGKINSVVNVTFQSEVTSIANDNAGTLTP